MAETRAEHDLPEGASHCERCFAHRLVLDLVLCVESRPADMSVVDEDRLTRRNADHLDDWRFR